MPSKDWKEKIADDEKERFERYATILADLQRSRGGTARALHAKQHAGVRAELEVRGDIPDHARVALFAEPKKFEAYLRFSNGSGGRANDDKPDVRGVALKILGVPGKKLIPGLEDETTQDILFINSDAIPFANVDDFVFFAQASSTPALLPIKLFGHFGFGTFAFLKKALASTKKIDSLATQTYFSQPTRFGDYAVRFSMAPKESTAPETKTNVLGDELAARIAKGDVAWDLRAQFFVNEETTPIEDPTIAWDVPFVTLARLTIPKQDLTSEDAKATSALVESLSFDPWHALVELRPLGAVMRARSPAYRESTRQRKSAPEPRST